MTTPGISAFAEGSRVPVGSDVPEAAAPEASAAVDDQKLRGRPRKNSNAVVPTTTTNPTPPEEPGLAANSIFSVSPLCKMIDLP